MADYYVDSSVPGPGTGAIGDPWDDINSNVGTLVAGDNMYLRGGAHAGARQDYSEHVDIKAANGCVNGTAANPITIANFPGEFVRMIPGAGVDHIFDVEMDYWIFSGEDTDYHIEIDKDGDYNSGFQLDGADNCTIEYIEMHNGSYFMIDIDDGDYNTIRYCEIYDMDGGAGSDANGIYMRGTASYNTIQHCTIYDCFGDCVALQSNGDLMSENVIEYNDLYATAPNAACCENGVDDKDGTGTIIRYNTIHGFRDCDGSCGGSGSDGEAIQVLDRATGAQIYGNEIYDISGSAIHCDVDGVDFYQNVIYDLVFEASIARKHILYVTSNGEMDAYNNTIVGGYAAGTDLIRVLAGGDLWMRNNICEDTEDIDNAGSMNCDYNGWYTAAQTCAGANDVSGATASFVDKANDDYHLAAGSTAIDAGVNVGLPYQGSAPDLGAYEYQPAGPGGGTVYVVIVVNVSTTVVLQSP